MKVSDLRKSLEKRKGKLDQIKESIVAANQRIVLNNKKVRLHEKAGAIIRKVGLETQSQLSFNISEITSTALNAVLDEPYDLGLNFVEKRDKTECDIFFARGSNKIDPDDAGGGAMDVGAYALRVASWSMQTPRSRPVLILDEPFKHLKGEAANRRMLNMVQEISKKLGIQIIMVSDERVSREATIAATDKLFETLKKKKVTQIKVE